MRLLKPWILWVSLVVAASSHADELIRYRLPSGEIGFADRRSSVPEGAQVLEIEALPDPPTPADPRRSPARDTRRGAGSDVDATRAAEAAEAAQAETWALERMRLEDAIRTAEQAILDAKGHVHRQCWRKSGSRGRYEKDGPRSCAEAASRLEEAEKALDSAREERAGLEDRCREAGCLPGWIRD